MISLMPDELIYCIACHLALPDALALLITSKHLFHVVYPRLFHSIHVGRADDCTANAACATTPGPVPVHIRSLFALKCLFRKLETRRSLCRHLRSLVFDQVIPQMPEMEFVLSVCAVLAHSPQISRFHWHCADFHLPLNVLSPRSRLILLCGNFDLCGVSAPVSWPGLSTLNLMSLSSPHHLDCIDLQRCPSLQHLAVGQDHIVGTLPFDPDTPLIISHRLFTGSAIYNLSSLRFDRIHITEADILTLVLLVNIPCLQSLDIRNCVEQCPGTLLARLAPRCRALRHLRYEWTLPMVYGHDSMQFLTAIAHGCPQLRSLALKLKTSPFQDCGQAVAQVLARCAHTLAHLSIEIGGVYSSAVGTGQIGAQLKRLAMLELLHLLLSEQQVAPVMKQFCALPRLKRVSIAIPERRHAGRAGPLLDNTLISSDMIRHYRSYGADAAESRKFHFANYTRDIMHIQPGVQWVRFASEREYTFTQMNGVVKDVVVEQ